MVILMSEEQNHSNELEDLKSKIKGELKKELKKELLTEIYNELKTEEKELVNELSSKKVIVEDLTKKPAPIEKSKTEESIVVSLPAFLKMATHAKKYANETISRDKWVEVIGLLAGKLDKQTDTLYIEDAYPMGHGNAVYAEIKDYKNFVRAFNDLQKKGYFICGWYHSHPSYGLFLSEEDMGTQARYQTLWDKSVALVIDPYMIDGKSYGFNIFRANLKSRKWYPISFKFKGQIDKESLPEILQFMNPVSEGKALYLEYDEGG